MKLIYKKKFVFIFFLLCSLFCLQAQRNSDSVTTKSNFTIYSIKEACKKIDRLEKELKSRDSILAIVETKLIKVDYIEKNIGTRFDDLYKVLGAFITLLLVISGFSFFRAQKVAEETAKKEFDEKFKKNKDRIKKIEKDAEKLLESIKNNAETAEKLNSQNRETIIKNLEAYISTIKKEGGQNG